MITNLSTRDKPLRLRVFPIPPRMDKRDQKNAKEKRIQSVPNEFIKVGGIQIF